MQQLRFSYHPDLHPPRTTENTIVLLRLNACAYSSGAHSTIPVHLHLPVGLGKGFVFGPDDVEGVKDDGKGEEDGGGRLHTNTSSPAPSHTLPHPGAAQPLATLHFRQQLQRFAANRKSHMLTKYPQDTQHKGHRPELHLPLDVRLRPTENDFMFDWDTVQHFPDRHRQDRLTIRCGDHSELSVW